MIRPTALPRPSSLAAVLLDAGGVLVDPDWDRVAEEAAAEGLAVSPDRLRAAEGGARAAMDRSEVVRGTDDAARGSSFLRLVLAGAAPGVPEALLRRVDRALVASHARRNLWTAVAAGVPDALRRLRGAGFRLVVVSNADGSVERVLAAAGLRELVDAVVDSGRVGIEKPDPRIFRIALDAAGAAPEAALHVGDFYEIDVVGARAAGVAAALVDAAGLAAHRDCPRVPSLAALATALLDGAARGDA